MICMIGLRIAQIHKINLIKKPKGYNYILMGERHSPGFSYGGAQLHRTPPPLHHCLKSVISQEQHPQIITM